MSRPTSPSTDETLKPAHPHHVHADEAVLMGSRLWLVVGGVLLAIFLIALDQTIVGNALPVIASKFNALGELAWIPTSFLLTQAPMLLVFGQITTLFPTKWVFISAVTIFELGSLLSGLATSANFLIGARAFQGVGAAGIFVCSISLTAQIIPLKDRPKFFGLFGGLFAISSILGPLLGGAFVDHVSWRWCFYINLPLSVPTYLFCALFVKYQPAQIDIKNPPPAIPAEKNRWLALTKRTVLRFGRLDWVGCVLVVGSTTSLVLALQWGGNSKPWNSGAVIACLVLPGVLAALFVLWQWWIGNERALVPLVLFKQRTQTGAMLAGAFTRISMFIGIYYLPLYFQAVKGHTPIRSGIDLIPLTLAVVFTAGIGGFIVSKTGRYWWLLFGGPLVGTIGFGLIFTFTANSPWSRIIGVQILMGMGIGSALQNTMLAVQADTIPALIPQATGALTFAQFVGGSIGIAVAGTIFQNKLASGLLQFAPGAPFDALRQSVTALSLVPPAERAGAIHAYVEALKWAIGLLGIVSSALTSVCVLLVRDHNLRTHKPGGEPDPATVAVEEAEAEEKAEEEEKKSGGADGAGAMA